MTSSTFQEALRIIRATPGYAEVGVELAQMEADNRVRVNPLLDARAEAGLFGSLTLGLEAIESSPLSLAQTLVHEHFHLRRQSPWLKTVSFWLGVVTRTHVMKRYEQPAYQAAHDFLEVVKQVHPQLASEALAEQRAIRQVFNTAFGGDLEGLKVGHFASRIISLVEGAKFAKNPLFSRVLIRESTVI